MKAINKMKFEDIWFDNNRSIVEKDNNGVEVFTKSLYDGSTNELVAFMEVDKNGSKYFMTGV